MSKWRAFWMGAATRVLLSTRRHAPEEKKRRKNKAENSCANGRTVLIILPLTGDPPPIATTVRSQLLILLVIKVEGSPRKRDLSEKSRLRAFINTRRGRRGRVPRMIKDIGQGSLGLQRRVPIHGGLVTAREVSLLLQQLRHWMRLSSASGLAYHQ